LVESREGEGMVRKMMVEMGRKFTDKKTDLADNKEI
jgi:uncharacterized protein YneF (UPF0154 family)